ncbi:MAG: metallophosphoesterase family protein [bacterium]|nr:metallophosphoesterase family protein [bacterium]
MKIAVIADVHDNYYGLLEALKVIKQNRCEQILFL